MRSACGGMGSRGFWVESLGFRGLGLRDSAVWVSAVRVLGARRRSQSQ